MRLPQVSRFASHLRSLRTKNPFVFTVLLVCWLAFTGQECATPTGPNPAGTGHISTITVSYSGNCEENVIVKVDGVVVGTLTPDARSLTTKEMTPGSHTIQASTPDAPNAWPTHTTTVNANEAKSVFFSCETPKLTVMLKAECLTAMSEAELYVDTDLKGKLLPGVPLKVSVKPGNRRIIMLPIGNTSLQQSTTIDFQYTVENNWTISCP